MTLTLNLMRAVRQICARGAQPDPAGGVPSRDDTGAARVPCRESAVGLAAAGVEAIPPSAAARTGGDRWWTAVEDEAEPEDERPWVRPAPDRPPSEPLESHVSRPGAAAGAPRRPAARGRRA